MKYGFVKVASVTPKIKVADCEYNINSAYDEVVKAEGKGAEIICLPELLITAYTCGDLFFQNSLQESAKKSLIKFSKMTENLKSLIFIGVPLIFEGSLYNCAVAIQGGKILSVTPKTNLPNYSEFYEKRHFTEANLGLSGIINLGCEVPFGTNILICAKGDNRLKIAVEICEDLWSPLPPSSFHALAGASLIVNLSASDETIGKSSYRRELVKGQSARLLCGYIYTAAGDGESSTDMVFAGHNIIAENGTLLNESEIFENEIVISEIDIEKLFNERIKNTSFRSVDNSDYRHVYFDIDEKIELTRKIDNAPFVPSNNFEREKRCKEILTMQAKGLAKRLEHTFSKTAVVGISGGLDSTLALIVTVKAFELINKPLKDIVAVTMPCFGTTNRTKSNAEKLCESLGVSLKEVNITETVRSNFKDIGHDETVHDVTFENVQARVRTLVLMNMANSSGGMVIGTGDLSELALGWATYNGDHMSMYGVNASVPKTLIRHLVAYVRDYSDNEQTKTVLQDILDTPVSPELLPAVNGEISQQTEEIVGPYQLHDFFLYYLLRLSFSPKKIYFLALEAFKGEYDSQVILKWMKIFYRRFFSQQFKRSCIPDGPKVGSVTLSPRGDFRMPSDASVNVWLKEIEEIEGNL